MVWGCVEANGIGRLELVSGIMNATKYIDELEKKMLPSTRFLFSDNWTFQGNHAPCRRAKKVQLWCSGRKVKRMNQPAHSPDLNPIENLWNRVSCLVSKNK